MRALEELEKEVWKAIKLSEDHGLAEVVIADAMLRISHGDTPIQALRDSMDYWEIPF
jgi:hypothetical protein